MSKLQRLSLAVVIILLTALQLSVQGSADTKTVPIPQFGVNMDGSSDILSLSVTERQSLKGCFVRLIISAKSDLNQILPDLTKCLDAIKSIQAIPLIVLTELPESADAEPAYTDFLTKLADLEKGRVHHWEIGDLSSDGERYIASVKTAAKILKAADPACIVVAGGAWGYDLVKIKADGAELAKSIDAFSIHLEYPDGTPLYCGFLTTLQRISLDLNNAGINKPVWITSLGWKTMPGYPSDFQSSAPALSALFSVIAGVQNICWSSLNNEDWGLTTKSGLDGRGKAFFAIVSALEGSTPVGPLKVGESLRGWVFTNGLGRSGVIWSPTGLPVPVSPEGQAKGTTWTAAGKATSGQMAGDLPLICKNLPNEKIIEATRLRRHAQAQLVSSINYPVNGTFERGGENIFGWSFKTPLVDDAKTRLVGQGRTGRGVGMHNAVDDYWESWLIPAESKTSCTLRAWVKNSSKTGGCQIQILWLSDPNRVIGSVYSQPISPDGKWVNVTVTGVSPAGALFARVRMVSGGQSGDCVFDDITLVAD